MAKHRVNLTLPEDLWLKLRARVPRRRISKYVADATAARLAEEERRTLRERLKEQYQARAADDRTLVEEFFTTEQEIADQIKS